MNPLILLSNISLNAKSKREVLDGVEHLVVPCIAIKQGVLKNIFYSASELESFANTWNGVPVPVNHPMDDGGISITANSTLCEDTVNIGRFYNVEWDSNLLALKGEIWINIPKAKKLGYIHIVERLENGEVMEVSTGLYGNTVEEKGVYNETNYDYVISGIRPDHLALLPNDVGACSIKDGCGAMRTNSDKTNKTFWDKVKSFFVTNEKSFDQIREGIYSALKLELGKEVYPWITDIFDTYFVFENDNKLFKRSYTLDLNEKIILVGENVEVRLERSYVPVSAEIKTNKQTMKPKKRIAIVNALALALAVGAEVFANTEDSKLEDAAKKHDLNFDDDGNEIKANSGCPCKHVVPVVNAAAPVVNGLTDDERATLARLQANEQKRLDGKREKVLAANKNLTKEIVATFNEDALDAMLVNVVSEPVVNYGISAAQPIENTYKAPSVLLGEPDKA